MSCVAAVVENVSSTPLTLVCGGGGESDHLALPVIHAVMLVMILSMK